MTQSSFVRNSARIAIGSVACVAALGAAIAVAQAPAQPKAATAKLPVSLNEVMVSLTDRSAEPFWLASQKTPSDQQGWDELEYNAMQIALSGVVVSFAGTGQFDSGWVKNPQWQSYAKKLTAVGMKALKAANAKDKVTIAATGNQLVDVCEGCHKVFKPDIPSQGILMHSEYYRPDRANKSSK